MQLHSAREDPNLQPNTTQRMVTAKWHKKPSNPLWQTLGIHKSTLYWLFYTRLFAWRKNCYQWLWMYDNLCVAVMLTWLMCQTLNAHPSMKNLCSTNLHKCLYHVYAFIAKEFIRALTDFRYAGNSTEWSQLQSMVSVSPCREGPYLDDITPKLWEQSCILHTLLEYMGRWAFISKSLHTYLSVASQHLLLVDVRDRLILADIHVDPQ